MRRITRSARIVRAATVAVVLTVGAALSGCTVAVEGTPRPAAEPAQSVTDRPFPPRGDSGAPRSAAPRSTAPVPPLPAGLGEDLTPHAGVLQRWVADGWFPVPLLRQTDPDTGVSAAMFGPSRPERSDNGSPYFSATGAPAGIITTFGAAPARAGNRVDGGEAARRIAAEFDGQLVDHEGVVVLDGRPAQDSVIDVRSPSGTPTRQLLRWIEFPDHVVLVQAIGDRADSAKLEQVRDIVTSTVRVP